MPYYLYTPALCALLLVMFILTGKGVCDWARRRYGRFYRLVGFWDDVDGDGLYATNEVSSVVTYAPSGHENVITNQLAFQGFDHDADGMLDSWEIVHGLCPTNISDAHYDNDGDGLINLHEYWADCEPMLPDGSNTALSVFCRSVDARIQENPPDQSKGCIYLNYGGIGVRNGLRLNTNNWAHTIDFSCASPWNSWGGQLQAGTALSRRHILFAKHFLYSWGQIYFRGFDGCTVTNEIIAVRESPKTDFTVGVLRSDLPDSVHPARILSRDLFSELSGMKFLPIVSLNQSEHAILHDVDTVGSHIMGRSPLSPVRRRYEEEVIGGDSGNPRFLIYRNEPILVSTFTSGGSGFGPFTTYYRDELQRLMNELSFEIGISPENYQIQELGIEEVKSE